MTNDRRACIAFICGVKINSVLHKNIILDCKRHKYYPFMIYDWDNTNIRIYDFERNCIIQGKPTLLFDFHDATYITIEWGENDFRGFDFHSQSFYTGFIVGNKIQILDYETSELYLYELCDLKK